MIRSFSLSVQPDGSLTRGLDVDAAYGAADTGQLVEDLPDVFEAIGEAARERDTGVVLLFDEIQFLSATELEALLAAVHRAVQKRLPVTFSGAGCRSCPGSPATRSRTRNGSFGMSRLRNSVRWTLSKPSLSLRKMKA